jgi:PAS domain S-box-containing protein
MLDKLPEALAKPPEAPALTGELTQPVTTLPAETPLTLALLHLAEAPTGAILAETGEQLVGMLTERTAVELTLHGLQYERMLGEVCSGLMLWARADEPYVAVYERMIARGVRHALVRDADSALAGILTETAILNRMGVEHFAHLDALDQIMTPDPLCLPASATAEAALEAMRSAQVGCVVVTDDEDQPVGVLTTRDATRLLAHHTALAQTPLETVMSRPVVTLGASRPVVEAARLMSERRFRHVVVTHQGRACGILSEHDIVRCLEHRYVDVLRRLIEHQAAEIESQRRWTAQGNLLDQLLSRTGALGLCQIGADGTVRFINAAALELLGHRDTPPATAAQLRHMIITTDQGEFDRLLRSPADALPVVITAGGRPILARAHHTAADHGGEDDLLLLLVDNVVSREAGEWLGFSRHAFSTMALPMVWADGDGHIALHNPAFDALVGLPTEHGEVPLQLDAVLDNAPQLLARPDAPAGALRARTMLRRADGSRIPVALFFARTQFRDAQYVGGFIQDLSQQVRVEHALHDAEQRMLALIDSSPDFVAVKDPAGRWQSANRAGLRMYGLELCDWQGKDNDALAALAPPVLAANLRGCSHTDRLAWARAEPLRYVDQIPAIDGGSVRHLDMIKTPIFERGQAKALMVIGRDITERLDAERGRREADARLLGALAGMDDLMLIADHQGVVCDHYPKPAPARFNFAGTLIGQRLDDLLPAAARSRLAAATDALMDGRGVQGFDYSSERAGASAYFNVRLSLLRHGDDTPPGVTLMVRDITELRRTTGDLERLRAGLEARVSERTAELEAALTELESFSYSLSHDLRAPLRAIAGFSRLLDKDLVESLPPEGHEYLGRIRGAVTRMDGLIDDMLDLARLSRKPLRRETVDLTQMARRIAEELDERAPERCIRWDIAPGMSARADPLLLHSVLDNLLGNAWKFTRDTAQACIRMVMESTEADPCFVVADNGAGFDVNYADKLFVPFQRLHSAREFDGNGIGLATVERIIRRHGGHISADSPPGGGAVFRFSLGR